MFDPTDRAFLADPYPALDALRESGPVHFDERLQRWLVTRHADVHSAGTETRSDGATLTIYLRAPIGLRDCVLAFSEWTGSISSPPLSEVRIPTPTS